MKSAELAAGVRGAVTLFYAAMRPLSARKRPQLCLITNQCAATRRLTEVLARYWSTLESSATVFRESSYYSPVREEAVAFAALQLPNFMLDR
jgi:hypothetical protein